MAYTLELRAPGLVTKAQFALGLSQAQLATLLGSSRRTMSRWVSGQGQPSLDQWGHLVRHVHPKDRGLAAAIAAQMGQTLVSLGLEEPPQPAAAPAPAGPPPRPAVPTSDLVDSVVCAAAEAIATTPQAIRPALLAAFDRAASVSLSVDEVRAALRPLPAPLRRGKGQG